LKSKTDADTRRPAADSLMDDMDPALLQFIKTQVTSFMRWELLRFLHENPGTADTAENIAQYTGRSVETVRPELDELVQAGVMSKRTLGQRVTQPADKAPATIYSFSADSETRRLIEDFVTACQDRHFRIKAVYHIIKNAP
jgi:DNA-binding transcriptional regulator YhcF (GntR family)